MEFRLLFASDWSSTAFIAAAATDGSSFKKIVTERLTWPNAITVDIHADRIYWADAFLDIIELDRLLIQIIVSSEWLISMVLEGELSWEMLVLFLTSLVWLWPTISSIGLTGLIEVF